MREKLVVLLSVGLIGAIGCAFLFLIGVAVVG